MSYSTDSHLLCLTSDSFLLHPGWETLW